MEMDVNFAGIEETVRAIESLPGLLGSQVYGNGMVAMAKVVAQEAQRSTSFRDRTGRLRASIKARKRTALVYTSRGLRKTAGAGARVYAGGPGAKQAHIIERGREPGRGYPGAAPRPFLGPALLQTGNRQFSAAGEAIQKSYLRLGNQITTRTLSRRNLRLISE